MKKSAILSDTLFTFVLLFLPAACLFRYWRIPLVPSLISSFLLALAGSMLIFRHLMKKREKAGVKLDDDHKSGRLLFHLAKQTEAKTFELLLKYLGEDCNNVSHSPCPFAETDDALYFPLFTYAPLRANDLITMSRIETEKKKILLCSALDSDAAALCTRLSVKAVTGGKIYASLKEKELLPELPDEEKPKRQKPRLWFQKRNSRGFFIGGIFLFLLSRLTPFPLYYLVFGGALMAAAALVRIFGYR